MPQRFLVLGDNHGDAASLERVLAATADEQYDFAVHVGDLTNAFRETREVGAQQLRTIEPHLEALDERARHGLVWVYGDRDYLGEVPYDLDVGVQLPDEGRVSVGGQQFTNDPSAVAPDVILVTHMEYWSLLDTFDGRAHFCGHTHHGRYMDRRLNSAFLQNVDRETGDRLTGGYFFVEVGDSVPFEVELRALDDLWEVECERHGERGVQFNRHQECVYCRDQLVLLREMAATGFYGVTNGSERPVEDDELVDYAVGMWDDPPEGFRIDFRGYLAALDDDRYAPLDRDDDGTIVVAEKSYAY